METDVLHSEMRKLVDLRADYDRKRLAKDKAEQRMKEQESLVYDALTQMRVPSYAVDLGDGYGRKRFTPRSRPYGRVLDRATAIEALRAEGREPEQIFRDEVRKKPLNQLVADRLERGEALPEGIDFYYNTGITIANK